MYLFYFVLLISHRNTTIANDACDAEKAVINGKIARASYDVKVLNVTEHATKETASDNYTVIE